MASAPPARPPCPCGYLQVDTSLPLPPPAGRPTQLVSHVVVRVVLLLDLLALHPEDDDVGGIVGCGGNVHHALRPRQRLEVHWSGHWPPSDNSHIYTEMQLSDQYRGVGRV